jgi:hypothetical protein
VKTPSPSILYQVSALIEGDGKKNEDERQQNNQDMGCQGALYEEKETGQTSEDPTFKEETVKFNMESVMGRPHLLVKLGKSNTSVNMLQDSGSKFNILSKNLLIQSEEEGGSQHQLKTTEIRLASHTGGEIEVLGETMIPISIQDTQGKEWKFELVVFQVTKDKNKAILGTSFITPRASTIRYFNEDQRVKATLSMPKERVLNERNYTNQLKDFHKGSRRTCVLTSLNNIVINPGHLKRVKCKVNGTIMQHEGRGSIKRILGQFTNLCLQDQGSFVTKANKTGETTIEVYNP